MEYVANFSDAHFVAHGPSVLFSNPNEKSQTLLTVDSNIAEPEAIAEGIAIAMNNYAKRQRYEIAERHARRAAKYG